MASKIKKQIRNPDSTLFKKLTRVFSGPIANRRTQTYKRLRMQHMDKYANKFKTVSGQSFKKSSYNPSTMLQSERIQNYNRAERYKEFNQFEFTAETAAALNIYADELTLSTSLNPILKIDCPNEELKIVLEALYYNILNVEQNLYWWARTMCKYGDFFLYLDIEEDEGVVDTLGLPPAEVEIMEGEDETNLNYRQFQWNSRGLTFENWQVAHFKNLGDDKYAPYGQCLKYNTRVMTDIGIKEIQYIKAGDKVVSFDLETQSKIISVVKNTICSGQKECYKISTRNNFVEASTEHKFLVYDKESNNFFYKFVEDIKIKDLLVINPKHETAGKIKINKEKPSGKNYNGCWNTIENIPEFVTEELSQFIGFMYGDGWIPKHNSSVCIALGVDETLNEKYIDMLEKFSGSKNFKRVEAIDSKGKKVFRQAQVHSKMFKTILERLGFAGKAKTKRFPAWIFQAEDSLKESFMRGLQDADGSLFIDKWNCSRYQLELASEEMILDAKTLLQSLGRKTGKMASRIKPERTLKETRIVNGEKVEYNHKLNSSESFYFYYYDSCISQKKKYEHGKRLTEDFIIEPVISIEETGNYEVYDIETDNHNHNFSANGIVVHNSIFDPVRRHVRQLCLAPDTKILTPSGHKDIKNIAAGDAVLSWDYNQDRMIKTSVVAQKNMGVQKLYKIRAGNCEIKATANHGLLAFDNKTDSYCYKKVKDLVIGSYGDRLVLPDTNKQDDSFELQKVIEIEYCGEDETYDIQIDHELHNFVADGIVSHNTLLEDTMMSYRIVRSPERRVYYIDVGDIAPEDVAQYVEKVITSMKRHSIVDEDTSRIDLRYNPWNVEEDIYIPVRPGNQTRVEPLPGGSFVGDIDDVKYIRDKVLTGLQIPFSYLSREDSGESQETLAQKDVRFATAIQRLQQPLIAELEKIGQIHLMSLGYEAEDIVAFKLSLNNPSRIAELQQLEELRTKLEISIQAQDVFSFRYIAQNILNLSEDEAMRIKRERYHDAKYEAIINGIKEGDINSELGMPSEEGDLLGIGDDEFDLDAEPDDGGFDSDPEGADLGGGSDDNDLLVTPPSEPGPSPGKRDEYTTPGSKGKSYKQVATDKRRGMGPRRKSYASKGATEKGKNTKRNITPGINTSISSLAYGISEDAEINELLKEMFGTPGNKEKVLNYSKIEKNFRVNNDETKKVLTEITEALRDKTHTRIINEEKGEE
jgi:intein/homing endonuclease